MSLFTPAYADRSLSPGSVAYVCADTAVNLRSEPQGEIIGSARRGEVVTILSNVDRNGYYKIRVQSTGTECYAYSEYLTSEYIAKSKTQKKQNSTTTASSKKVPEYMTGEEIPLSELDVIVLEEGTLLVVVSDYRLNMRKGATIKANRIKYLKYGDVLEAVSLTPENNYLQVKDTSDGTIGYVDIRYIAYFDRCYADTSDLDCWPPCTCTDPDCTCKR